jgi:Pyruvate/2-oxoacid:ferredoxin oxidoreductase delta subunit
MVMPDNAYRVFAGKMMHKDSKWIPEILRALVDEPSADLLLSLPGTAAGLAAKLGRPEGEIESGLKDLFHKGLAFKKTKGGITTWRAPAHLAQFHDATILWPEAPDSFYELWKKYMDEEWPQLAAILTKLLSRPLTRVIPVEKSLAGEAQVLSHENVRQVIESGRRFAVARCTCRLTMRHCDAPTDVCLQINRAADYTIERGSGHEITKEEALAVAARAAAAGLVHVTMNKAEVEHFICNCCGCCCQSFSQLIVAGLPLCDPSRYRPEVDADRCTGCGDCEDRCWFEAIAVGDAEVAEVKAEKCMGCGQCVLGCKEEAIVMGPCREPGFIPA